MICLVFARIVCSEWFCHKQCMQVWKISQNRNNLVIAGVEHMIVVTTTGVPIHLISLRMHICRFQSCQLRRHSAFLRFSGSVPAQSHYSQPLRTRPAPYCFEPSLLKNDVVLIFRHNQSLSSSLKIIQMMQHFEHISIPIAEAMQLWVNTYKCKSMVPVILRYLNIRTC